MQGLITLDFGNTNPHAGIFQKAGGAWSLHSVVKLEHLNESLKQLGLSANNASVVVCEVKAREEEIAKLQEEGFLITRVKDYWRGNRFAGMPVNYARTLGEDRLICAFYNYKKEKIPTLIIDAGTFVTIDVVSESGFQGGYICPGVKNYFDVYQKGEQLKDVSLAPHFAQQLPQDTAAAMAESYSAFAALAKKTVVDHNIRKVLLTGGDTSLWETFFEAEKKTLVVETHPHLIHFALHFWMTTQIELV